MNYLNPFLYRLSILSYLIFSFSLIAKSQESINAAGSLASGSGGSANCTIGQVTYHTNSGTNGSVAEGVHQAYEISKVSEIEDRKVSDLLAREFPNPTNDYLLLLIESSKLKNISYQLYDLQGKLLLNEVNVLHENRINMSNLEPSTYFLKVIQNNNEVETFKIIKK